MRGKSAASSGPNRAPSAPDEADGRGPDPCDRSVPAAVRSRRPRSRRPKAHRAESRRPSAGIPDPRRPGRSRPRQPCARPCVGEVIFPADSVSDAKVQVVDHRRQGVEIGSILATQHRIGKQSTADMTLPAHKVPPPHGSRLETKPPVRLAAGRFEPGAIFGGQVERGAVVDRRTAQGLLTAAAAVELACGLIGGVPAPARLERFGRGVVGGGPLRLTANRVGRYPQPGEVLFDRLHVLRTRPFASRIVEPQNEAPAVPPSVKPVEQRPCAHCRCECGPSETAQNGQSEGKPLAFIEASRRTGNILAPIRELSTIR